MYNYLTLRHGRAAFRIITCCLSVRGDISWMRHKRTSPHSYETECIHMARMPRFNFCIY